MRVFGAATGMGPVAALLCFFSIGAATALAYIPGRDAPVTVETICNPKPDAADILLPLPCDLTLALRAVDTPGGGTYFIGKYEISRYQWDAVMTGKCEALSTGPGALPLREVTPSEIRGFLDRYNAWLTRERKSRPAAFSERAREAGEARLPTEAEWEFAARGGLAVPEAERTRDIPPEKLREFGVISDPIPIHEPERIGSRLPNPLGLYDTVGNVKEMVASASDSLIAFRGGSYKHNPGEIDIGRHDEITAINERGAERAVSDLGLRLAFSAPGYSGDPAASPEPAGGGVNLPLALALSAAAFAAGGILVGLVVWFYQRRRLGMPVEEELALQEDLSKWQHGYAKARTALIKALKEVERRKEAGLAADVRLEETSAALAQTLKEAAAVDEARRAAEARAEAAERRAEKAAAHNEAITRAAEEQIRQARAELEELRKRAEESEQARLAAEERASAAATRAEATQKHAEQAETALAKIQAELENARKTAEAAEQARKETTKELVALRKQRESAEATHKRAVEQAEAALAQIQAELENARKIAEAAEQSRQLAERRAEAAEKSGEEATAAWRELRENAEGAVRKLAEERVNLVTAEARKAAEQAQEAMEHAQAAVADSEQVRKLAEEQVNLATAQAQEAAKQAQTAKEQAQAALMDLERVRNLAEEREAMRISAEETAQKAAEHAEAAVTQARVALVELEQVRKIAEERETMRIQAQEEAQKAVELARAAAEQAKEAAEQAHRARMELEQLLAVARQGQQSENASELVRTSLQDEDAALATPKKGRKLTGKIARSSGQSKPPTTHINSIGMDFVLIPAGSFQMGSPEGEGKDDEHPQHLVTITRPFYLGSNPVTQAQWEAIMEENPSKFNGHWDEANRFYGTIEGATHPVETVSWNDAQEFIRRLNAQEGHNRYRLPTEAEWEYACRAGSTTAYYFGDDLGEDGEKLGYYGRCVNRKKYWDNPGKDYTWRYESGPVGQKESNVWGLYDMYGNVREWVQDWYGAGYYAVSPSLDPQGPERGTSRVLRGGCYDDGADGCRSASRYWAGVANRSERNGFRLALDVE